MINTAPPTSNSVHGREKCFQYNNCGVTIFQWLRGAAVKDLISLVGDLEGASLNPGEALLLTLYILFSFQFFDCFFLFDLFPFILTADPSKLREDLAITYF